MPHQCTNCGHVFEDGSKEMLSGCPDCGGNKFQYHPGDVPDSEEPPEDADPPERDTGSVTGAVGRAANKVRDAVTGDNSGVEDRTADEPGEPTGEDAGASTADEPAASVEDVAAAGEATPSEETSPGAPETGGVESVDSGVASDAASGGPATDADADSPATEADPGQDTQTADASAPAAGDAATREPAGSEQSESSEPSEPGAADPTTETVDASTADTEDGAQANARSEVVDMSSLPDRAEEGRVVKEPDDDEDRPDLDELRRELNDQFESIRIVAPGQYELNLMELYDRQEYIIALQEDGQYVIEVPDAWEAPDPTEDE
jgi:predicted  nucleic acid-binding Zn-ribbon protein